MYVLEKWSNGKAGTNMEYTWESRRSTAGMLRWSWLEEQTTEEQQKLPDLSMIKADFVGAKELAAATPTLERGKKQSGMAGETTDRRPSMAGEATNHQSSK
jgi:hypothetical protein